MIEYTDIATNETGMIVLWKKNECQKFTSDEFLDFLNKTISENVFAANMLDVLIHIIIESLTAKIKEDVEVHGALENIMCEIAELVEELEKTKNEQFNGDTK